MKRLHFHWLSVVLCTLLLSPAAVFAQMEAKESGPSAEAAAEVDLTEDAVSLDEVRRFVTVFRAVKQGYVDPVDDATLMSAAIRGLLLDLDPHSAYLNSEQSKALDEAASGAYDGLGVEVVQQPDRSLLVIAPIDDTPAARAGILPGDVITAIDGKEIAVDGVDAAIESMRGPLGSQTRLTVSREGEREPLNFTLTRETIRVSSVRTSLLELGYAYLRISSFQANTGLDLERKLKELIAENNAPLRGLILDLRSNPGGLLNAAVEAADVFLDAGVIVSTRGRLPHSSNELSAHKGDLINGAPIIILVDGGTASAAEVLAGALRDHHRGLVLGSQTFGKGSVQTVLPLDNGDSIKVTTARYFTPNGTSIQATGIVPDVLFDAQASVRTGRGFQPPTVRESDLPGHLRGANETLESPADDSGVAIKPLEAPKELEDSAVREALNLLKGLALFTAKPTDAGKVAPKK